MEDILNITTKNSPSKIKEILQRITNSHSENEKILQKIEGNIFKIIFTLFLKLLFYVHKNYTFFL